MKHALPNLDSLKVFESAARHLSFSAAAEELCLTKGAVSYQIKKLESELNTTLFKRSIRQVLLTDSGQKLLQSTQQVFGTLSVTLSKLHTNGQNQSISIAVTTYVAARWLSPMVTTFCHQNPNVALQFQHTVNSSSFNLDDVDIAIRWQECDGRQEKNRLKEIPMDLFPVCSPNLSRTLDGSGNEWNFENVTLLCEDRVDDLWQKWAGGSDSLDKSHKRVISDANVRVQAAIDGQGLVLADEMMRSEINSGSLVAVSDHRLSGYGYVIMSTDSKRNNAAVKLLLDWLVN